MRYRIPHLLLPAALLLAGCGPDAAPTETDGAAVTPGSGTGASAAGDALEDDVIVLTNEPFWQATVAGGTVVLQGVGAAERRFTDVRTSMTADGRRIDATDAAGDLVVIVRKMRCEDDMSGARFPMTGLLTIDGQGPYRGCARPAAMPLPMPADEAGETDGAGKAEDGTVSDRLPARFVGRWDAAAERCNAGRGELALWIRPDALQFYESTATPVRVRATEDHSLQLDARYAGEGDTWTDTRTLTLEGDDVLLVEDAMGNVTRRVRCET
ncbi:conserved exported hypothetical protein [Luteimonas sp. 9C]|uniref:hypothetical protein n=1 Tax=Luteimonas sp. 9C TaxID=2653148 RepID=UPI0012F13DD4|nr:hypothetical protein [Luteimonas sp. 9C]VXB24324.1 conserved exported hypothetical protein [Luteimonas sp. 9C]